MSRPTLGFVGAGRAATGLALAFAARGWHIKSVLSSSDKSAEVLAGSVGAKAAPSLSEVVGDLIIIAVPDGAIAPTAAMLAYTSTRWAGRGVVHTSGATDIDALAPLKQWGAMTGGLHPAYPFSADRSQTPDLRGVTFALEADDDILRAWLTALIESVGGTALELPPGGRAIYHAALVFASNYTISLIALAGRLLESLGASPGAAKGALDGLVGGMVENVKRYGAIDALPGPLVRADVGTIEAHLKALHGVNPDTARLYAELAWATYPILQARGIPLEGITQVLNRMNVNAKDDS